jgi:hypothetical protein
MAEQAEPLHGLRLTGNQVIITVTSTGCTDKADFKIALQESQPPIATFIRVQPDFCRVVPHSVDIAFSLREVGAAAFKVANPFEPGPVRLDRPVTTEAVGEETLPVTTLAVGEEGQGTTTLAIGEEHSVTTLPVGEETPPVPQGRSTAFGAF